MRHRVMMMKTLFAVVFLFLPHRGVRGRPMTKQVEEDATYKLMKYGYYTSWVETRRHFEEALQFFKVFNGFPLTGSIGNDTLNKLASPRCGLSDPIVRQNEDFRRYYPSPHTWDISRNISWYWDGNKSDLDELSREDTFEVLREAFRAWTSANSALVFKEKKEKPADIEISFSSQSHTDPFPFDGRGQSIGHAFYPRVLPAGTYNMHGNIHFDRDELFTLKEPSGTPAINFKWAALHEIGHTLGLMHSNNPQSIMNAWYNSTHPVLTLHASDIEGISCIYGGNLCQPSNLKTLHDHRSGDKI